MNIVVTVKQVVDPNLPSGFISIDAASQKIVSTYGLPPVMNGYDANALEAALKLREAHGGKVTVICLGDNASRTTLKRAHAMGADAVMLLSDPAWLELDSAATGRVLAAAIRKIGAVDLVLCGRQASDTDAGQVLFWIAAELGMPAVCPVSKIEESGAEGLVVQRLMEDGFQRVAVTLPALLGISSEINEPRAPSLKGTMLAGRSMAPLWKASDLGALDLTPRLSLRSIEIQTRTSTATLIEGATPAAKGAALADKLHEAGLI
jgi:electron transfer flavoprotein beta subunit